MFLEKETLRRIIRDHKITSFREKDEDELVNIFYETFAELGQVQGEKLATKEDLKLLMQMMDKRFEAMDKRFEDMYKYMDKRFEAVDKRFEDMNKKFTMMFTFMNIGFGLIILMTILFKFFV